ncbi:MAG: hypothetical protein ABUK01_04505 [Leptospirales bacterium]
MGIEMGNNRKEIFVDVRKALSLFEQEKYTQAFNLLTIVEKKTDHIHLISKIANIKVSCLMQVGNVKSAVEYVDGLLSRHPVSGQIAFIGATMFHKLDDMERANRLYLRAVCLFPTNTRYSLIYSQFLREKNRSKEAISILKRCLRVNKIAAKERNAELYFVYLEISLIYYYSGYLWRSLILFEHCSKLSNEFLYHDLIADIYLKKQNYEEALAHIKLHLDEWGDSDPEALYLHAKALVGVNKKKEAFQVLQKCGSIWGELVVTPGDMAHLFPLMQDGSLKKIPNLVIEL